jgi:hypothetical protein
MSWTSSWFKQYVVVRKDLPKVHQTIQAAHAAALAAEMTSIYDHYPPGPMQRHLVILEVSNKFKLRLVSWYLKYICGVNVYTFVEEYKPVSKWGMTAISFYCNITKLHLDPDTIRESGNKVWFLKLWSCDTSETGT